MKIAIFAEKFPEVTETFVINHVVGLIKSGHDVIIIADEDPKRSKVQREVAEYDLIKRTYYRDQIVPVSKPARIKKALLFIFKNFIFHPILIIDSLNYFKYKRKALRLECLLYLSCVIGVDVLHCHFGPVALRYLFLKEILGRKVRFLTTFHGYDISSFIAEHGKGIYRKLFEKGDMFLPVNQLWKDKLIELGCDSRKIETIRMGIDTDNINLKQDKPLGKPVNLITVGRLVEKKGFRYAIQSIAEVARKYLEINYLIVGEGELKNELKALVSGLKLDGKVKFIGYRDNEETLELIKGSDIFLLTSVEAKNGDLEGVPVSLMEAMACGVPVISTFHSGIPELVKDGVSGLLVAEKDVDAVSNRIIDLIEKPSLYAKLVQEARKAVEENYNLKKTTQKLNNLYMKLKVE